MAGNWITFATKLDKEVSGRLKLQEEDEVQYTYKALFQQELKKMKRIYWGSFEAQNYYEQCKQEWIEHMKNENRPIYIPSFGDKEEQDDPTKGYTYSLDLTFPEEMPLASKLECIEETYTEVCKHTTDMIACIEQRGYKDDDYGHGIHTHANITLAEGSTLDKFYKNIKDILKKYKLQKTNVTWRPIKGSYKSVRDRYVRGDKGKALDKDGVSKMSKVEYDKRMRTRLNLHDTYDKTNLTDIYTNNILHNNTHDNTHTYLTNDLLNMQTSPHSQARMNVAMNNGVTITRNITMSLTS